jgi:hypothetical protein
MLRKGELVELESGTNGKQPFSGQHAQNILTDKSNTGPGAWKLPEKSKYKLEDGKLIRGTDTGANPST